jgi:sugar phosphate isomerase/epimerase
MTGIFAMPPIGLQLYSVRENLKQDYEGTIRKVAAMGYNAVETARMFGESPQAAAGLFRELGLKVVGAHHDLPVGDKTAEVVETLGALGTDLAICPWQPPEKFQTVDGIKGVCDMLNEADANGRKHGLRVAYHNHDFEYKPLPDGSLPVTHMLKFLEPTVLFEIDTYWVQTAGQDVVKLLNQLGERAVILHLKDGPAQRGRPMTALGEGVMDIPAILKASHAKALVVELDECATDMMEAVDKSYVYLKGRV